MLLSINPESERPLYLQLKAQLIKGIASGKLKPGERLPSIRALADELGINLHTVNKTYSQLRDAGYLTFDRRGAFISEAFAAVSADSILNELSEIADEAICGGIDRDEFLNLCAQAYERNR